jgi:hypothetical protein
MIRRKFTADRKQHTAIEQWSERMSIGEYWNLSEGVKTYPIPLDEEDREKLELTRSSPTDLSRIHMQQRKSQLIC